MKHNRVFRMFSLSIIVAALALAGCSSSTQSSTRTSGKTTVPTSSNPIGAPPATTTTTGANQFCNNVQSSFAAISAIISAAPAPSASLTLSPALVNSAITPSSAAAAEATNPGLGSAMSVFATSLTNSGNASVPVAQAIKTLSSKQPDFKKACPMLYPTGTPAG